MAGGLPMFRHQSVGQNLRSSTLLEVFLAAFLDAVADIVRGGLMRRYREREEDLGVVRGRILVHRQSTVLADRGDLVACRFDDLTADNRWNQLVKCGLHAARRWLVSDHLLRRWNGLTAAFDEVSRIEAVADLLQEPTFDRQAERYRTVLHWVRWILSELSPTLRGGDNHAPGLLFDTNELFQRAVAAVLRNRLRTRTGMSLRSQASLVHLAEVESAPPRPRIRLRPDLILESQGHIIEIADSKWKRIEMDRNGHLEPAESDVYQLLAYAAGHACDRVSLIYPWHDGLAGALPTALRLPRIGSFQPRLTILCVDVHDDAWDLRLGDRSSEVAQVLGKRSP
jgi:5-methylcytosine-specific restriction enzyme subunit McrC